jgi:hypothetical protein
VATQLFYFILRLFFLKRKKKRKEKENVRVALGHMWSAKGSPSRPVLEVAEEPTRAKTSSSFFFFFF